MHWACCLMPIVSTLAYIWGVLSLIFAFVSVSSETGLFWNMGAAAWMWSGLVAGVLAMGRGKKPGMCRAKCGCGQATCATCSAQAKCC